MNVYLVNKHDWVLAENVEQAKETVIREFELDASDIETVGKVSSDTEMLYPVSKLPSDEQRQCQRMNYFAGELCAYKPFSWVVEHEKLTKPCILASFEA
ncbi:MAG: hypothetical protein E6Y08_11380 [Paenibacillus sp.]|uniref:hypothetical protein n=1 Tax=Paenibacillus sp. TaxID=58172 RepID=UPI00290B03D0|nr:hypothetical protein [Paenibacillus sp.]MDU4696410.1 hypothetical protein [Paenibacillus sp.]